jgi:hypothetical protein
MTSFCFVSTSRGSHFMTELLASLAASVEAAGHSVELRLDEFPLPDEDRVYVVIPHEFDAWGNGVAGPDAAQRARTIALCTENPGTLWFEQTFRLVAEFGAAVSINRSSAAELCRRGIRCEHLQLGYFAGWDRWRRDEQAERTIDVLYLGAADPRRDPLLAGIGASLWARECQFLVPPLEPRTTARPDFLIEARKYERLGQAKVLLNLHRTTSAAFEWMRFLEAICNGCVVVTEPSLDAAPLLAGEHFVEASAERIAGAIEALLEDPARLRAIRLGAYDFVREQLPMTAAGERLVELAGELPRKPPTSGASRPAGTAAASSASASAEPPGTPALVTVPSALLDVPAARPGATAAVRTRTQSHVRRSLAPLQRALGHRGRSGRDVLATTPAYAAARPRVSALCVVSSERAHDGIALLARLAANASADLEILIAAGSQPRGAGAPAAVRFLRERPELAGLVLSAEPAGVGVARNLLAGRARGEYLLVLPVAGGIFPLTVERLSCALDANADALFAYSMVAALDGVRPVELRGSLPWEPQRLQRENWIDTPVLIRRDALLALGGWATEPALDGLEDFDLWCRCAEAGAEAAHLAQVLAWHPSADDSQPLDVAMLAPAASALLRERSPGVFGAGRDS